MSFENPSWLWGLLALVPLALLEWWAWRRARAAARTLVGEQSGRGLLAAVVPGTRRLGAGLRLAAAGALLLGAAGPQWGRETVRRQAQGSDVVFVLDVSASMEARDVVPSRLEEARREAYALLDRLPGSRVGVVAFAGDAVRLCPLTLDQTTVRLVLSTTGPGSITTPGTDVGRALRAAAKMLPAGRREEQAIVLWTDGEDNERHAEAQIEDLQRSGIRVFAVGVGTPAGEVIPVLDDLGRTVDVKKDEQGNVVRSRLDEALIRRLGRATRGGAFFASRPGGELPRLVSAMGSLGRSQHGMRLVERPVARFPWLAALAALLLGAELARPRHRSRGARRSATAPDAAVPARKREARPRPARTASPAAVAGAVLVAWVVLAAGPAAAQTAWARGDAAFRQKRWAAAESLYALRARRGAPGPLRVNLATARALAGRPEEGERDLSRLAADPGPSGQAASYNLGTLLGERGQLEAALGELRRALERDPGDADARWNYEVLRRRLEQEQQKRGGGGPEPQKPQPGQSGQQPQPQPQPGQNPQQPQQPQQPPGGPSGPAPPDPAPRQGAAGQPTEGMTRQQAEQLLGSLGELERLEQARLKRMRVLRDRRTKDW